MSKLDNFLASKEKAEKAAQNVRAVKMFKERVNKLMVDNGINQTDIGKILGLTQQYVSMMMQGNVKISLARATDIAKNIGLDETEFLLAVVQQHHPEFKELNKVINCVTAMNRLVGFGLNFDSLKSASEEQVQEINGILAA